MNLAESTIKIIKLFLCLTVLSLVLFTSLFQAVINAQAQTDNDWSDPTNLSRSGSASDPILIIDSTGTHHVLWQDEIAGYIHASGDGVNWSPPEPVEMPFEPVEMPSAIETLPLLVADSNGFIHALWRDEDSVLYYSVVDAEFLDSFPSWTEPVQLSGSALDIDVALDDQGNLHLSYVRSLDSPELPAGVYYSQLKNGNNLWSTPTLLYSSPYFRSLELENSNVDIATGATNGESNVYVVWDNRPRERVYLAKSFDGGLTWSDPEEVDQPDITQALNNPLDIQVGAEGQNVLMVWQRRDSGGSCSQYYLSSGDSGETWGQPSQVFEGSSSCGQSNQLVSGDSGLIYFWTISQNQVNLLAWDSKKWSNPQDQPELSAFEDPETLKPVTFDCRQPQFTRDDRLAVVGCDTAGGGDIWFTSRLLTDVSDWFPSDSEWGDPDEIVNGRFEFKSPVFIAGPDQRSHVLWSQVQAAEGLGGQTAIYYSGWDGEDWSQPVAVLLSPQGSVGQFSAATDAEGRLLVVWNTIEDGKMYFTWANSERAGRSQEWSEPIQLPSSGSRVRSPAIFVNNSGTIYVIYTVPLNEGRGVYLIRSDDGGETWSQPLQVFDGVRAQWQMIDQPQLIQLPDGVLQALWLHRSLPDGVGTLGLYSAYSEDGGVTWSKPEEVVTGNVMWYQIASGGQDSVFRTWQEEVKGFLTIKYQRLLNSDMDWGLPESLSSFGESLKFAKMLIDPSGVPHLLQIVQDAKGSLILRHWMWENERWSVSENINLAYGTMSDVNSMAATVSQNGELELVYSTTTGSGEEVQHDLFFMNRSSELQSPISTQPVITSVPATEQTPAITPTAEPVFTPTPQPTPTPDLVALNQGEPGGSARSSTSGIVVGVALSGLMIAAALGYGIWRVRNH